jgi:hypothetical protein
MTIINNERLWLGLGVEIILLISFSMIMYFILTSGNLKQSPFTSQRNGKISFWIAAGLILLANEISLVIYLILGFFFIESCNGYLLAFATSKH